MNTTYKVDGMTCGHCVAAVSTEVAAVPGVETVTVDLATGALTITSTAPVDVDVLRAAVDEAGYQLAS